MRYDQGWIKWHRSAFFGDIGRNINCLGLWVALLSMASWKDSRIIWGSGQREIPSGSVLVGLREVASSLGCSKNTILRWLSYLESTGRIRTETGTRGTLVTVLNWKTYQCEDVEERDTSGTDAGPQEGQARVHDGPLMKKVRRKKNTSPVYTEDFDLVFKQYPRKEGKAGGFKSYEKLNPDQREQLGAAIRNYGDLVRREGRERRFIKQFSAFMSSWEDYLNPEVATETAQAKAALSFGEDDWGRT